MITSRQNASVKTMRSLKDKKQRLERLEYLVEGEKQVKDAYLSGQKITCIMGTKELVSEYKNSGIEVVEVSKEIASYVCDSVSPQGICASVKIPQNLAFSKEKSCVILDGVKDPGNVGTIIRTCAAVGVENVILIDACDAFSPKCVRSTMGGIYHVNVFEKTYAEALEMINDMHVIACDMAGVDAFSYSNPKTFCLIVGSESHGVSKIMLDRANSVVKLNMKPCMESLNAGVALSVILYKFTQN